MSERRKSANSTTQARFRDWLESLKTQQLRGWMPLMTPQMAIVTLYVVPLFLLPLGVLLLLRTSTHFECVKEYDPSGLGSTTVVEIAATDCVGWRGAAGTYDNANKRLYLQYQLENFYANHRRYVRSVSAAQLRGEVLTPGAAARACSPRATNASGQVLHPCGLVATSVFTDRFVVDGHDLDESNLAINWSADVHYDYKNPDLSAYTLEELNAVDFWLPENLFPGKVENAHFINWMRNAALPNFRKVYGQFTAENVTFPLTVQVANNYPVTSFDGRKKLVVSELVWLGGRTYLLGCLYVVLALVCIAIATFLLIHNRGKLRTVGDVNYLQAHLSKVQ